MRGLAWKAVCTVAMGFLFLLPFFGWIAAEPAPFHDPGGFFSLRLPEGWSAAGSATEGAGLLLQGPAGPSGVAPSVRLIHETAGVVTIDERWYGHLGRLRYDLARVNIVSMEDREKDSPPHYQAVYTWAEGDLTRKALARLTRLGDRFFLVTASAAEEDFGSLEPLFVNVIDSLRPGDR